MDFQKLNSVMQKDYFPLPFTDALLNGVVGHECYSLLDEFLGYNQVLIAFAYRIYTTFIGDWETFVYKVMPFGLYNAPITF